MLSLERTCFQNKKKIKKVKQKVNPKSQSQKKVKLKSQKSQQSTNSQKKVKQTLCIGKQVKEKRVTRQIAAFLLMAYGFQSIKNSRTFLVVQLSPFPAPSQPQPPTPESQDPYPAPATVPGSLQPQAFCCSNFGAGCCQGQALGWLRLAPGGGVRLRSSSGRLQAGWGMRGWAGKKKSKKSELDK